MFLGYKIKKDSVCMAKKTIEKAFEKPKTKKALHSSMALAKYYAEFMPDWGKLAAPLWNMVKQRRLNWTEEASNNFDLIKQRLTAAPGAGQTVLQDGVGSDLGARA